MISGVAILGVVVIIAVLVSQSTGGSKAKTASTTSTTVATAAAAAPTCPKFDGSSPRTLKFSAAPPACIDPSKKWTATFDTTEGKAVVALDTTRTPGTVNNFIFLALYHYYDRTTLFRIDNTIDIIQGGSPTTNSPSDPGPGYSINDEGGKFTTDSSGQVHGPFTTYSAGDLIMARSSGLKSGGAQFFFVAGAKAQGLASGGGPYVTFGHATQGLDVLQKIEGLYVACPSGDSTCLGGKPSHTVTINSVTIAQS